MADPITVAKVGYTLLRNWKPILIGIISIMILLLTILVSLITNMFSFLTGDSDETAIYKSAAGAESVPWKEAYGLDAVRYDLDFSKANPTATVKLFIDEHKVKVKIKKDNVSGVVIQNGHTTLTPDEYEERTIKRIRPLSEVLNNLKITGEQAQAIQDMAFYMEDEDVYTDGAGAVVPPQMIEWFKKAGAKYGIDWSILAAIAFKENSFRTDVPGLPNETGEIAQGMMQFLPSTWAKYGVDANGDGKADPLEFEDAIMAAANYLKALGASNGEDGMRQALYQYSGKSSTYADDVLKIAKGYKNVEELANMPFALYPLTVKVPVTSGYGDLDGRNKPHKGIDFGASEGTGVVAVDKGTVVTVLNSPLNALGSGLYGDLVVVDHGDYETYYAHLSSTFVFAGAHVEKGTLIGKSGNSGDSTGPHLHFEVRVRNSNGAWVPVDPTPLLKTGKID